MAKAFSNNTLSLNIKFLAIGHKAKFEDRTEVKQVMTAYEITERTIFLITKKSV